MPECLERALINSYFVSCKVGVAVDTVAENFTPCLLPGEESALPSLTTLPLHQSLLATGTANTCRAGRKIVLFN